MNFNVPFGHKYLAVISTHGYYTIYERVGDTEEYRPMTKGLTDEFGLIYYPICDDIYGEPETDSERDALAQMLANHITLSEGERYDLLIKNRMEWMKGLLGRVISESEVTDRDSWYGLWEELYSSEGDEEAGEVVKSESETNGVVVDTSEDEELYFNDVNDADHEDFMIELADQQEKLRRHRKWPK